jgi:hypothetical protein
MFKDLNKLCSPASVYLALSAITILIMLLQNSSDDGYYHLAGMKCPCDMKARIFVVKAFYTVFWTFTLNALCKSGYTKISWFIMLFPGFMMALAMLLYVVSGRREGMKNHGGGGGGEGSRGGGGGGGGHGRSGNTTHHVGSAGGGHDNYAPVRHRSKWGKVKHDFEKEGNMRRAFMNNPTAGLNKMFQSKWMADTSETVGMVGMMAMMMGG